MFERPFERDLTIHVSDNAIIHLLMAGIESYHVRHWGDQISENRGPAETAGLLFGYYTSREDMDVITVDHVSTDTFAKGTYWEVGLNETVTQVKKDVIRRRWPHLSLVGDFHTHPYKSYTDAANDKGWQFSDEDYKCYDAYDPNDWSGRCALILTIAKLSRVSEDSRWDSDAFRDNVIRWQIGDFRFWLSGCGIDKPGEDARKFVVSPSKNTEKSTENRPHVYLDVPTINGTSSWFQHYDFTE